MSLISEQVKKIRSVAGICTIEAKKTLLEAADTIETLSAKLSAANMEQSDRYYGGGWIACEDRLPEKHIDVLVSFGDEDPVIAWYSEVNKHWKNSSTDNVITADVVAWQPLPEPYRL